MIISHKYKFIYFKTRKTASTSVEIVLSQFCGENDVITPISPEDEKKRQKLGFLGPQNYKVPLKYYSKSDWLNLITNKKRKLFYNHATAAYIKSCIPEQTWNNYFKFTFERNPFDKAISLYYYDRTSRESLSITDYLNSVKDYKLSNWEIYTINNQIMLDFIGRYENIDNDLTKIKKKLGISEELKLPKAKSNFRKSNNHYSSVLNSEDRDQIEVICASEIAEFDYRWNDVKNNSGD